MAHGLSGETFGVIKFCLCRGVCGEEEGKGELAPNLTSTHHPPKTSRGPILPTLSAKSLTSRGPGLTGTIIQLFEIFE
jgi:hypothetical protein